jgi:hypothetical protein
LILAKVIESKLSHIVQAGKGSVRPFFDSSNIASSQHNQIKTEPIPHVPKQEDSLSAPLLIYGGHK